MTTLTYEIVQHDSGWAYKVDGVFSETFLSHDAARHAAEGVAKSQRVPGEEAEISGEDKDGRWREEHMAGTDRPETIVKGCSGSKRLLCGAGSRSAMGDAN